MNPDIPAIRRALCEWYKISRRSLPWRKTRNPYAIWVSEVMLQQTQVNTVIPYYQRFMEKFPDVNCLGTADLQEVLKLWEGLGYYARCRNLHKAAGLVMATHKGQIPDERDAFRKLPGVGDYIASAVLSIAFDQPYAVVDGNVKRVLARIFRVDAPVNRTDALPQFQTLADSLLDQSCPGIFNQAVMELGALVCIPRNPACERCPVQPQCTAFASAQVSDYPKREKRPPVPVRHMAAGLVIHAGKILIVRRPEGGMLGGLWEFPAGEIANDETPESACMRHIRERTGLTVNARKRLACVRHAYTHFKLVMDLFSCELPPDATVPGNLPENSEDMRWTTPEELKNYPLHKAVHKAWAAVRDQA